jgi:hypothetical protein
MLRWILTGAPVARFEVFTVVKSSGSYETLVPYHITTLCQNSDHDMNLTVMKTSHFKNMLLSWDALFSKVGREVQLYCLSCFSSALPRRCWVDKIVLAMTVFVHVICNLPFIYFYTV